jgi:hypothetical protein
MFKRPKTFWDFMFGLGVVLVTSFVMNFLFNRDSVHFDMYGYFGVVGIVLILIYISINELKQKRE